MLGPNLRDGLPPELRDHLDDEVVELDEVRARLPLRAVHLLDIIRGDIGEM